MSKCPNPKCSKTLGCSCQIRTASNGQKGCSACIAELEKQIAIEKAQVKNG